MIGFNAIQKLALSRTPLLASSRTIRARWERGYLKDLYHRRLLIGADPLVSRSSQLNWDYASEIYAFSHRVGAVELSQETVKKALTNPSFFTRPDVEADATGAQPSREDSTSAEIGDNSEFVTIGNQRLMGLTSAYLRAHFPKTPEDFINAVASDLCSDELLSTLASYVGMNHLVRTGEFPPTASSLASVFRSLVGCLPKERSEQLVIDFLLPQLVDTDFADAFPLAEPFDVLTDLLKTQDGAKKVEPRIIRSSGVVSAEPLYIIGIYADEVLVGESAGESIAIACDLAAREGLLRRWDVTTDRVFLFGDRFDKNLFGQFSAPSYKLSDVCSPGTDLSMLSVLELAEQDKLNVVEMALQYKDEIRPVVGQPLRKRLRHKFSRGSIAKRSFRYMVKPRVYTIS
ncbi:hypothetical protein L596_024073 [Steinernema carpocapsae]|uniref:Large ribosomal subunit protein mL44 n=1 Tax=Steinernema carpocapsae TaxID=34508 RepID=A0A4U5MGB8_STECR|nr:hypothetical protein L596_024073 [Steinernema carpocapsae]